VRNLAIEQHTYDALSDSGDQHFGQMRAPERSGWADRKNKASSAGYCGRERLTAWVFERQQRPNPLQPPPSTHSKMRFVSGDSEAPPDRHTHLTIHRLQPSWTTRACMTVHIVDFREKTGPPHSARHQRRRHVLPRTKRTPLHRNPARRHHLRTQMRIRTKERRLDPSKQQALRTEPSVAPSRRTISPCGPSACHGADRGVDGWKRRF
jgi:hypothetical protein